MTAPETGSIDELARLLALLVRLEIGSQAETIVELDRLEIGPSRIAELLGTTPATARVTIHQKKNSSRGKKEKKGDS